MSDTVALALVSIIPSTLAAIFGFLNGRTAAKNHEEVKSQMITLNENTNGKMDKLLLLTGTSEHAKGVLEGKEDADKKN